MYTDNNMSKIQIMKNRLNTPNLQNMLIKFILRTLYLINHLHFPPIEL